MKKKGKCKFKIKNSFKCVGSKVVRYNSIMSKISIYP